MSHVMYAVTVALRLLYTPVILVVCLVKYLTAVQREQILVMRIEDGTNTPTRGSDNHPGGAGVTDTSATFRAKATGFGGRERAGESS